METPRTGPSGATIDTPRHRALGSASRVAILRLVRAADAGLTANEVAGRVGLHLSTTRAHLDRLVEAGLLVKARASAGLPGRPPWRYRVAAPEPAPAPYRELAAGLLDHLAATGDAGAARAGEAWGRRLAASAPTSTGSAAGPVDSVFAVLDELGFDPRRQPANGPDTAEVHLHTCPFLDLVRRHPDVMCALHAGVVRGALHERGAPDGEAVLEPFAAPTACVLRLRLPGSGPGGGP